MSNCIRKGLVLNIATFAMKVCLVSWVVRLDVLAQSRLLEFCNLLMGWFQNCKWFASVNLVATNAESVFFLWFSELITAHKLVSIEFMRVFFHRLCVLKLFHARVPIHEIKNVWFIIVSCMCLHVHIVNCIWLGPSSKLLGSLWCLKWWEVFALVIILNQICKVNITFLSVSFILNCVMDVAHTDWG